MSMRNTQAIRGIVSRYEDNIYYEIQEVKKTKMNKSDIARINKLDDYISNQISECVQDIISESTCGKCPYEITISEIDHLLLAARECNQAVYLQEELIAFLEDRKDELLRDELV